MLEIPYNMPLVFTTLAIILMGLLPLWKSHNDKTKGNMHFFALAWILWGLFQSVLSLNRWYMDRKGGYFHFIYPWILLLFVLWFVLKAKKGLHWSNSLNTRLLFAPVILTSMLIPIYTGLMDYKQISSTLCSPINYLLPAFGVVGLGLWTKCSSRMIQYLHLSILIMITTQMFIGYGGIPNAHQSWDFTNPNYAFQHFPYTLMPNLIYPLLFLLSAIGMKRGK